MQPARGGKIIVVSDKFRSQKKTSLLIKEETSERWRMPRGEETRPRPAIATNLWGALLDGKGKVKKGGKED